MSKAVVDLSNTFEHLSDSSSEQQSNTFDFMKSKLEKKINTRSRKKKDDSLNSSTHSMRTRSRNRNK